MLRVWLEFVFDIPVNWPSGIRVVEISKLRIFSNMELDKSTSLSHDRDFVPADRRGSVFKLRFEVSNTETQVLHGYSCANLANSSTKSRDSNEFALTIRSWLIQWNSQKILIKDVKHRFGTRDVLLTKGWIRRWVKEFGEMSIPAYRHVCARWLPRWLALFAAYIRRMRIRRTWARSRVSRVVNVVKLWVIL